MDYTVLVADDEKEIRNLLRLYLENESFKVIEASTGPETLEIIKSGKPDICLLDIMMPGIDGLHVMQEVRKDNNIPIMIISASTADAERILGLNLGADDYIPKWSNCGITEGFSVWIFCHNRFFGCEYGRMEWR